MIPKEELEKMASTAFDLHKRISEACDGHSLFNIIEACCAMLARSVAVAEKEADNKEEMKKRCIDLISKFISDFYEHVKDKIKEDQDAG